MKIIIETDRLYVRRLVESDLAPFFDLMNNPNVMDPIPQSPFNYEQSSAKLTQLITMERSSTTKIWSLCEKGSIESIGICGLLKNDQEEDEIAYRIREQFWGVGYGTEIAKGLIDHCFIQLHSELITADVSMLNKRSIKILDKFFVVQKEFFNPADQCLDRRYVLTKNEWLRARSLVK